MDSVIYNDLNAYNAVKTVQTNTGGNGNLNLSSNDYYVLSGYINDQQGGFVVPFVYANKWYAHVYNFVDGKFVAIANQTKAINIAYIKKSDMHIIQ